jgi:hypothetical protein
MTDSAARAREMAGEIVGRYLASQSRMIGDQDTSRLTKDIEAALLTERDAAHDAAVRETVVLKAAASAVISWGRDARHAEANAAWDTLRALLTPDARPRTPDAECEGCMKGWSLSLDGKNKPRHLVPSDGHAVARWFYCRRPRTPDEWKEP